MANKSTFINDLTEGSVMKRLIRFTLPLMLANLLQVCYNLVDLFFVGQYAGTDALSAVSISSNVTMLMFFCFMGIATGGQIYVDSTLISAKVERTDVEVYYIPATKMANDAGVPTLANMVMMGHVLQHNPELSFNGTEVTVQKLVPPKKAQLVELNMKALEAGRDYEG